MATMLDHLQNSTCQPLFMQHVTTNIQGNKFYGKHSEIVQLLLFKGKGL